MKDMEFFEATPDSDEMWPLLAGAYIGAMLEPGTPYSGSQIAKVEKELRKLYQDGMRFFLAYDGGIQGYAAYTTKWVKGWLYLQGIAVLPAARGKKVIDEMLDQLKSISDKKGLDGIVLEVQSELVGAIKAYYRNGFTDITVDTLDDVPKMKRPGFPTSALVSAKSLAKGSKHLMIWMPD